VQALKRSPSRRQFLAGLGGVGAAVLLDPRRAGAALLSGSRAAPEGRRTPRVGHLAWVWRFDQDGEREGIRSTLAKHGLGVLFKTHDGTNWMPDVGGRSGGPERVAQVARFFESAGVPFHAWCVAKGSDPVKEARMAASVLASGARSFTIDLEAHDGFWVGSPRDAERYGAELRRWQPEAMILTSVDGRPWEIDRVPMDEFAAFSDGFSPQTYWNFFRGPRNTQ
jgi:hypothetical protein